MTSRNASSWVTCELWVRVTEQGHEVEQPFLGISMTNSSTSSSSQLWAGNLPLAVGSRNPGEFQAQAPGVDVEQSFGALRFSISGLEFHLSSSDDFTLMPLVDGTTGAQEYPCEPRWLNKEREILLHFFYIKIFKNNPWQGEGCFRGLSLLLLPGCEEYWFEVILHSAVIHHHKHLQSTE